MHRLIVVLLAAVDALVAAGAGLAAVLAPATLVWVIAFGGTADWSALWPTAATVWQAGHLVPLTVTLPAEYLAVSSIDVSAASFVVSLAPLAFATFTAIFAARSGRRASQAGAWLTGALTGTAVFTAVAVLCLLTAGNALARVEPWQAVALPALVFAVPALLGALATEWSEAADGGIARLRDRLEQAPHGWGETPGVIARGSAVVVVGLVAIGALTTTALLWARGGEVIALYESAHVDAFGATLLTIGQLVYLPTVIVWAIAFVAGPGFAVGAETQVSAAGTQVGVLPGIPLLGVVPESTTPWLLLLALLPVALGAVAGWIARSRLVAAHADEDPIGARVVSAVGIAVVAGAVTGLFATVASGSIGPGSLAAVGPAPGPVALAVGLEVLLGAAILLLSPRGRSAAEDQDAASAVDPDTFDTAPIDLVPATDDTARRPAAPPVD